jgi:hypothetical protein
MTRDGSLISYRKIVFPSRFLWLTFPYLDEDAETESDPEYNIELLKPKFLQEEHGGHVCQDKALASWNLASAF